MFIKAVDGTVYNAEHISELYVKEADLSRLENESDPRNDAPFTVYAVRVRHYLAPGGFYEGAVVLAHCATREHAFRIIEAIVSLSGGIDAASIGVGAASIGKDTATSQASPRI